MQGPKVICLARYEAQCIVLKGRLLVRTPFNVGTIVLLHGKHYYERCINGV